MFPLTYRRLSDKVNNTLRKKTYRTSLEPMIYLFPLGKSPIYKGHTFPRLACSPVTFSFILSALDEFWKNLSFFQTELIA